MVEQVKCIHPELQIDALAKLPHLLHGEISIHILRAVTITSGFVANGSDHVSNRREGRGIVNEVMMLTRSAARTCNVRAVISARIPSGAVSARAVERVKRACLRIAARGGIRSGADNRIDEIGRVLRNAALEDCSRRSGLGSDDAADLPPARCSSHDGVGTSEFGKWHNHVCHQDVRAVDLRISFIKTRITCEGQSLIVDGTVRLVQRNVANRM